MTENKGKEELRDVLYGGIREFKSKDLEIKNKYGQIITISACDLAYEIDYSEDAFFYISEISGEDFRIWEVAEFIDGSEIGDARDDVIEQIIDFIIEKYELE